MIVVLDSGVWISALQFGGVPRLALERAVTQDTLAICDQIETEVTRALTEKMSWDAGHVRESLALYLRDAIRTPVSGSVQGVCRDPKDDMVLECALGARARLVISGDSDLLVLGAYRNTRILGPRAYLALPFDRDV